jgi:transposase
MNREALGRLFKEDLITLVLAQASQIEALSKRLAALQAKLGGPPKTPKNFSVPPSKADQTDRREQRKTSRRGRPGTFRALAENPDHTVESFAD